MLAIAESIGSAIALRGLRCERKELVMGSTSEMGYRFRISTTLGKFILIQALSEAVQITRSLHIGLPPASLHEQRKFAN